MTEHGDPALAPEENATMDIRSIINTAPVTPVLRIDDPGHAVPLAGALVDGGLLVLEITLRTPCALAAAATASARARV